MIQANNKGVWRKVLKKMRKTRKLKMIKLQKKKNHVQLKWSQMNRK